MSVARTAEPHFSLSRLAFSARRFVMAAMVMAGGIVYVEPSPHELVAFVAIAVCFGTGLRIHPRLWPMTFLLLAYIAFGIPAMLQTEPLKDGVTWMAVSAFLVGTSILYASFVAELPEENFAVIGWAYVAAAMVPAITGTLGYFGVGGADLFVLYGRARGTFKDPNVLGPFLILPFLFLADGALRGSLRQAMWRAVLMLPIVAAVFFSFSRGAWGHLVLSCALLAFFTFALSHSIFARLRVLIVIAVGAMALVAALGAALSVPKVQALFSERAQLTQQYDTGHEGRFGRWERGFALALEKPLGIGPLQFAKHFPEDPHNTYLNALMSFGWGGALAYYALVISTIILGARAVFVPTPWQRHTIVAYSTFLPLALLSAVIDTDHWRHYFLVVGCLWGLIAATHAYRRAP
ncbi:O-antigen ligase family protein [Lutibaculum baratangense]|uniref:O-antigen ligase-related domain-containing protein n=1 Tax=Lutibaculum baratangense AMV1 TaxID=631454 RepID=V4RD15_9HYPH|nr:O-antigen ligase family protein [Lutibaculum baratangense]ESR23284.1 hypothetical protein N177_3352 [Lutibaculum baratangense AMV1]